jgi:hypothetical protein
VGDEVDDIEALHVLCVQQVDGLRLLLAEDRHQHVGRSDLGLAAGLHMEHRSLQHTLEAERRLDFLVVIGTDDRRRLVDVLGQLALELQHVGTAGVQDLLDFRNVQQSEQQVLDGDELVTLLPRTAEALIDSEFEFTAEHAQLSSIVQSSGC